MSKNEIKPLKCKLMGDIVNMSVGISTLTFAAENHPDFWDGESGVDVPNIKITNKIDFAKAVTEAINKEDEDGSNLLTRMLDEAIAQAVEDGCDGVEIDP